MKWAARFFVFACTFFLGVVGWGGNSAFESPAGSTDVFTPSTERTDTGEINTAFTPATVRVLYDGWGLDGQPARPVLKFVIQNGLDHAISYDAHMPTNPFPELRVNGTKLPELLSCGTGIRTFQISPGNSAEVLVDQYRFLKRPSKNTAINVGFYLRQGVAGEYTVYRSEPFLLPDEFQATIGSRGY